MAKKKTKTETKIFASPIGIFYYPFLAEPYEAEDKKLYKTDFLISKKGAKTKEFKEILEASEKLVSIKFDCSLEDLKNPPIVDMATIDGVDPKLADFYRIRAKNKLSVPVFDRTQSELTKKEIENIKGGDHGRIFFTMSAFSNTFGDFLNFWLDTVQYKEPGEALGGGATGKAKSLMTDLEVEIEEIEEEDDTDF